MKKQMLVGLAATALACGVLAQNPGVPDRVQPYGNSGWTPEQAYDGSQQTEQGVRTPPTQRIDPRVLRDRELREQRERMLAQQRERELRNRELGDREWERERLVAQQRERELRERELRQLRERDRALAQQREREHAQRLARERELAQLREHDRRGGGGNRSQRSWDRDRDGVANRVDRAPNDPRYR